MMRSFFKKMTGSRLRPAMGRRRLFACLLLMRWLLPGAAAQAPPAAPEVVVVGGGLSGTFAALQAARLGASVLLLEETPWLGGMLTAAGVSAIDGNHRLPSGLWGEFRDSLYARYGGPAAVETGWVSNTLFEPAVAQEILRNMVAATPRISLQPEAQLLTLQRQGTGWEGVFLQKNQRHAFRCRVLVEATEQGDWLRALGVPRDLGMDSRAASGEAFAPAEANDIVQDLTYVAILKDYGPGADRTIPRPRGYDPDAFRCCCETADPSQKNSSLIDCARMLSYGRLPNGKYMINWPNCGNDIYLQLADTTPDERRRLLEAAKLHTLRFVYFMQHELGYRQLGIAEGEFPTSDGLPLIPYYREAARIRGLVRLTVNHLLRPFDQPEALYRTGIAVGDYPIDHHHKKNPAAPAIDFINIKTPSFNLPLGALIPPDFPNLIAAEKSISVSNIVNGASRLQPVIMGIGQAAGALAALAVQLGVPTAEVPVRLVQASLLQQGAYLMPYIDVPVTDFHFSDIQQIGATGIIKGVGVPYKWANQTWFYPEWPVSEFELLDGLRPWYPQLAQRRDASGMRLRPPYLLSLLSAVRPGLTQTELTTVWQEAGFGDVLPDHHAFNRLEAAVLVNRLLRPFDIPVDHRGHPLRVDVDGR